MRRCACLAQNLGVTVMGKTLEKNQKKGEIGTR